MKQALHKQKAACQAAAKALAADSGQQQTEGCAGQQAGSAAQQQPYIPAMCPHVAVQPEASMPSVDRGRAARQKEPHNPAHAGTYVAGQPEASMHSGHRGPAAGLQADRLHTGTAAAQTVVTQRYDAGVVNSMQTTCAASPQQPQQQAQQEAPDAQTLQTSSAASSAVRLLQDSALEVTQTADRTQTPVPMCHQHSTTAEGAAGKLSLPVNRHKELIGSDTPAPDANSPLESAGSQAVPSLSLQQSGQTSTAKASADARPQLWQVQLHLLCLSSCQASTLHLV